MRKPLLLLLVASLVLASCGWRDSRVNPRNWFGRSKEVAVVTDTATVNPLIPRRSSVLERRKTVDRSVKIGRVTELRIEPTNVGAIIYASGIADRQGAYLAQLRPLNQDLIPDENGVMVFDFVVTYPSRATAQGSELTRTVHEAYTISAQHLAGIRVIRVEAAQNAQESRRR